MRPEVKQAVAFTGAWAFFLGFCIGARAWSWVILAGGFLTFHLIRLREAMRR